MKTISKTKYIDLSGWLRDPAASIEERAAQDLIRHICIHFDLAENRIHLKRMLRFLLNQNITAVLIRSRYCIVREYAADNLNKMHVGDRHTIIRAASNKMLDYFGVEETL